MKKLGKLNLKSEKMLSHKDLVSIRGGSGPGMYGCTDTPGTITHDGIKKYCCHIELGFGYEDRCETCFTPNSENDCVNATGMGTMTCVQIDFTTQCGMKMIPG